MSGYIYETKTHQRVWEYVFAKQKREQYRICQEYGIGEYSYDADRKIDRVSMGQDELPKLKKILDENEDIVDRYRELESIFNKNKDTIGKLSDCDGCKEKLKCLIEIHHNSDSMCPKIYQSTRLQINNLETEKDLNFFLMIEAFVQFIESHPDINPCEFEGPFP